MLVGLSPAIYSWTLMATSPSSLPLGVRTVEWLRMHHFNWLVDEAEHVYYTWNAPKKGGPQLKTLPAVGLSRERATRRDLAVARYNTITNHLRLKAAAGSLRDEDLEEVNRALQP